MTNCPNKKCGNAYNPQTAKYCMLCGTQMPIEIDATTGLKSRPANIEILKRNEKTKIIQRYNQFTGDEEDTRILMQYIPGGSYWMGSNFSHQDSKNDERPEHYVSVQPFYMGVFPVTQGQYTAIIGENPSAYKSTSHPIESISFDEAIVFCEKLSDLTSKTYRLPSESEWEYACRSKTNTFYSFGDKLNAENCWCQDAFSSVRSHSVSVGQYQANDFALNDMHGNVWEYCYDEWHESYFNAPKDGSSWTEQDKCDKVARGGSWKSERSECRSASRRKVKINLGYEDVGFRVVCSGN
jgi:formylglycine-generating enzyme required for sulfatase activity